MRLYARFSGYRAYTSGISQVKIFCTGTFLGERLKPRLMAFRRASAFADAFVASGRDPSTEVGGWPQARRRDFNRLHPRSRQVDRLL